MHGLVKDSYKLRCKSSSGLQQARPKDSTHGNCVICGRFMEELQDQRCNTEECQDLLKRVCMDRGLGMQANEGADLWTIIKSATVLEEGERMTQDVTDNDALHNHTCQCGRGLKMPRADICTTCYRERNLTALQDRRRTTQEAKQARKRKNHAKPVSNKIKGLDKIKLG